MEATAQPVLFQAEERRASESERRRQFLSDLKACGKNLRRGRLIHEAAVQSGADSDLYVASALISMYAKCGSMEDARSVFDSHKQRDVVCWNALLLGYVINGVAEAALDLLSQMRRESFPPDSKTFVAALKACSLLAGSEQGQCKSSSGRRGKQLHLLALSHGYDSDIYLQGTLVDMYSKCGSMEQARAVFENFKHRDLVCWNALILGYVNNELGAVALDLFWRMAREGCLSDARTFVAAIKACTLLAVGDGKLSRGKQVHLLASMGGCSRELYVQGTLLDMYTKGGNMEEAGRVFGDIEAPDVVCWTAFILGYVEKGDGAAALELLSKMRREGCVPDARIFVAAFKACSELATKEAGSVKVASRRRGRMLHLLASNCGLDLQSYVHATVVDMYAKCGFMEDARKVFDGLKHPNVVSWTALILGFVENGESFSALDTFHRMKRQCCEPNSRTFLAVLKACVELVSVQDSLASRGRGEILHLLASSLGWDSNAYVQSSLVDMYAKSGVIENARKVFDSMKNPDVVSWNALIMGYVDNGECEMALERFAAMVPEGSAPNCLTFISALRACGILGALETGKEVHSAICSQGLERDVVLTSCLVDFYAKCGSMVEAEHVFESHPQEDLGSWNALMSGYSSHGNTMGVFDLFERMQDRGLRPDAVTFNYVLSACSHAGLVDKGKSYFELMSTRYSIQAEHEHYTCMIDILGRSNKLDEAMVFVRSMPLSPRAVTWMAVLGSCRKWKNLELARFVFEALISLDDGNSAAYVLMTNINREAKRKTPSSSQEDCFSDPANGSRKK